MAQPILTGKNLTLGYSKGTSRRAIVKELDFSLFPGQLTCLLGPNGVGKSTLVKAMLGQLKPWKGELHLEGKSITSFTHSELAKKTGVVLTDPVVPGNMTVGQLVSLGRIPHTNWTGRLGDKDYRAIDRALFSTSILPLKEERLAEISDGQRQKAMIARALAQDGQLMILDEPTAHLDLVNRYEIMYLLREIAQVQHKAILVVTHDLEIALETADRFWLMGSGMPLLGGIPEEMVLAGALDRLLPGEKFQFDLLRGKIQSPATPVEFSISGAPEQAYWIRKALQKAGLGAQRFEVNITSPFSLDLIGESGVHTFRKLGDLIAFLKR